MGLENEPGLVSDNEDHVGVYLPDLICYHWQLLSIT